MKTTACVMYSVPILAAMLLTTGCASPPGLNTEAGPHGTIAYFVPIDSSEHGARVEVNGETVGTTPMTLKIYGDRDGSFHNFGSYDYIVRVYPPGEGKSSRTKVYKTGVLFGREDKIPERIHFDFNQPASTAD